MKAMILAAGRGTRMLTLTQTCPKPLLKVDQLSLIEHHVMRLRAAGYSALVVNTFYLGEQIHEKLGDGAHYGIPIEYSDEAELLETGGGIFQALDKLGDAPFLVINGDVWCDHPLTPHPFSPDAQAHLVLVDNPEHHPDGDFSLDHQGWLGEEGKPRLTYSGIGWYSPAFFRHCQAGRFPLAPLIREKIAQRQVSGEHYQAGIWLDIGTPERLDFLRQHLRQRLG